MSCNNHTIWKFGPFITKRYNCYSIYYLLIINRFNNIKWHIYIKHLFHYNKISSFNYYFVLSTIFKRLLSTISFLDKKYATTVMVFICFSVLEVGCFKVIDYVFIVNFLLLFLILAILKENKNMKWCHLR